ncbi:LysE family translocator [Spartinivicinus ruber]|uniref:LysE family translocator n=1 Tax=Spartinivicinus ruber TaxID=2683272 RepID=UPI0013D39BAC|nr:LysE family translocator [Spartinivicinus ruber]
MELTNWLALIGVCILGAISPGPSLAVVMRNTVSGSRGLGVVTAIAHAIGVGGYALLSISGLAVVFAAYPSLQQAVTLIGAGYLAWLGVKAWRATSGDKGHITGCKVTTWQQAAQEGLLISLLNPKLAIFFIALFSQFIQPGMGWLEKLTMALTVMVIDGGWYCLIAVLISQQRVLALLQRQGPLIDRVTGVVLIGLSIRVVTLL